MIVLLSTDTITAKLSGAPTSVNPYFSGAYVDSTIAGGVTVDASIASTQLNGATPVTVVAAPSAGTTRHITRFTLTNTDTGTITFSILFGGQVLATFALAVGDVLQYSKANAQFTITNASGGIKQSAAVTWGSITGSLASQTDLNSALALKAPLASPNFTGMVTRAGTGTPSTLTNNSFESYDTVVNAWLQNNIQNLSASASASSDTVATADTGTDSANYIDVGINSSVYSDAGYTSGGPLDSYVLANGGHLGILAGSAGKQIKLFTGGTLAANLRATITDTGLAVVGTVTGSNLSGTNTGDQTISITGDVTAAGSAGALSATVTKINGTSMAGLGTGLVKNTTGTGVPSIAASGDLPGGPYIPTSTTHLSGDVATSTTVNGHALSSNVTVTASDVGLGSVTNDVQTKAAIVPNTVPAAGALLVGNAGATAYASVPASGDASILSTGAITVKGINGTLLSGLGTGILKNTTGTGVPSIAVNSDLPVMTATVGGAVPTPPNNTTTFLRGDGTFAAGSAATFNPNLYVTTSDNSVPASSCLIVNGDQYEIGSGFVADVATDGILEISPGISQPVSAAAGKTVVVKDNLVFAPNIAGGMVNDGAGNVSAMNANLVQINGLDLWGHSYLDNNSLGTGPTAIWTNDNSSPAYIYAAAIGLPLNSVVNHAVVGSSLTAIGRASGAYGGGNFARALGEIYRSKQSWPFSRSGNAHLICWGINDLGNNTVANMPLVYSTGVDVLTVLISKMRSAAIFNGNGGANLAYSGTWTAAPAAAVDYTSNLGWSTSTTGGTFTFTIPYGYQGEPICFAMVGYNSSNTLSVAWSGTAGVTGTTNLASRAVGTASIVPMRITNLTAANAGQTIIGTVTLASQTFILDGVWLESLTPVPVLVCNTPRLPCKIVNIASGSGVTAGGTTAFTDTNGNFANNAGTNFGVYNDVGATITETDAQGALTGNTAIVASVSNPNTLVLTANTALAKTSVKYTIGRIFNGYPQYGTTNMAFSNSTVANHSGADAQVLQWNSQVINGVVALFDSMVQVVDLDSAIGADANLPINLYSWFAVDALHPNDYGSQRCAKAIWDAAAQLRAPAGALQNLGLVHTAMSPRYGTAPYRRAIFGGANPNYLPDGAQIDVVANAYTCVVGDAFAYPFMISEAAPSPGIVQVEQLNSGVSTLLACWYDDTNGVSGISGYPTNMRWQLGNFVMAGSATVQTVGTFFRVWHPGLQWLVLIVQALGATTSTLRTIFGPSMQLPMWTGVAGSVVRPIAWKASGVAAGSPPTLFPSGAALVGCAGGTFASASAAPLVSVRLTTQ
jgi:hypothetical protein